jgi:hypothetical protein
MCLVILAGPNHGLIASCQSLQQEPFVLRWLPILLLPVAVLPAQAGARAAALRVDNELSSAAFANGPNAIAASIGNDGVLLWPGAPIVRGPVEAARFVGSQEALRNARLSWQPLHLELAADSSLVLIYGVATLDLPGDKERPAVHQIGRYVAAWQRSGTSWRLQAFGVLNMASGLATTWQPAAGPKTTPRVVTGAAASRFAAADSSFSAETAPLGIGTAFAKWAAPDAVTFAGTGELNIGPARIGAVLSSYSFPWTWSVVAAGAATDGSVGWTAAEETIRQPGHPVQLNKHLTLWKRMPDGAVRYIALAGSTRP